MDDWIYKGLVIESHLVVTLPEGAELAQAYAANAEVVLPPATVPAADPGAAAEEDDEASPKPAPGLPAAAKPKPCISSTSSSEESEEEQL